MFDAFFPKPIRQSEFPHDADCVRLPEIAGCHSHWQNVIHGQTADFRQAVTKWLIDQGRMSVARRYALCGRGDSCRVGEKRFGFRPRRCGHRLCPRCSRYRGCLALRKILGHLNERGNGDLLHVVLTQQTCWSELFHDTRQRFEKGWKRFYPRLRKLGFDAMLAVTHAPASRDGCFHIHRHLVIDVGRFDDDRNFEKYAGAIVEIWRESVVQFDVNQAQEDPYVRHVSGPRDRYETIRLGGQAEFFEDASDPAERVVQYVIKDVVQGVEKWVSTLHRDMYRMYCDGIESLKLHRTYGSWRGTAQASDEEKPASHREEVDALQPGDTFVEVLVDDLFEGVHARDRRSMEALSWLVRYFGSDSTVGSRLSARLRALAA